MTTPAGQAACALYTAIVTTTPVWEAIDHDLGWDVNQVAVTLDNADQAQRHGWHDFAYTLSSRAESQLRHILQLAAEHTPNDLVRQTALRILATDTAGVPVAVSHVA